MTAGGGEVSSILHTAQKSPLPLDTTMLAWINAMHHLYKTRLVIIQQQ